MAQNMRVALAGAAPEGARAAACARCSSLSNRTEGAGAVSSSAFQGSGSTECAASRTDVRSSGVATMVAAVEEATTEADVEVAAAMVATAAVARVEGLRGLASSEAPWAAVALVGGKVEVVAAVGAGTGALPVWVTEAEKATATEAAAVAAKAAEAVGQAAVAELQVDLVAEVWLERARRHGRMDRRSHEPARLQSKRADVPVEVAAWVGCRALEAAAAASGVAARAAVVLAPVMAAPAVVVVEEAAVVEVMVAAGAAAAEETAAAAATVGEETAAMAAGLAIARRSLRSRRPRSTTRRSRLRLHPGRSRCAPKGNCLHRTPPEAARLPACET